MCVFFPFGLVFSYCLRRLLFFFRVWVVLLSSLDFSVVIVLYKGLVVCICSVCGVIIIFVYIWCCLVLWCGVC